MMFALKRTSYAFTTNLLQIYEVQSMINIENDKIIKHVL